MVCGAPGPLSLELFYSCCCFDQGALDVYLLNFVSLEDAAQIVVIDLGVVLISWFVSVAMWTAVMCMYASILGRKYFSCSGCIMRGGGIFQREDVYA